jgi:quercetin dioxygenase-like cupin family protein
MIARTRHWHRLTLLLASGALASVAIGGCSRPGATAGKTDVATQPARSDRVAARPAVIEPGEGERRVLRGGAAPLWIKIDRLSVGSERLVLGSSDLPPGDAIRVHRHLQEDEIILITRGTGRVQLGREFHTAGPGAVIFIPQGTCIALENVGSDTLSNTFIFSAPGFERVLRAMSSAPGEPAKSLTPTERAAAFHEGHAEAGPSDC